MEKSTKETCENKPVMFTAIIFTWLRFHFLQFLSQNLTNSIETWELDI